MSSTLAPKHTSPNNPITPESVFTALSAVHLTPKERDVPGMTSLLTGIWEMWNRVEKMPDYMPEVDEDRFPRTEVHRAEGGENEHNAWAWKAVVRGTSGGLLAGKTVCLKDNIALKGVPCLLGTNVFTDWTPNTDATVVTRVLEAGGTITGKGVCEDLCLWGVSNSAASGPIDNVYAKGYSAGGSTSGTGVIVARGEADMGIGGDQGGSIRIPASKNGIVGLKPTWGLVPYTGIASFEATLDHTGPMTRTILDNALLLQALAGADDIDDRQGPGCPFPGSVPDYPNLAKGGVNGLKIGIITESLDRPTCDKRVSDLVVAAAKKFIDLGASVVEEVSIPMHIDGPDLWAVIGRLSGASTYLGRTCGRKQLFMNDLTTKMLPLDQARFERMFISCTNTVKDGVWGWENMSPTLLGKATNLVRKLRDEYLSALGEYDVLITPTLPYVAQRLPAEGAGIEEMMENSAGVSINTSPFNLTGLPALSLPIGFLPSLDDEKVKLPVGMQIVAKMYGEGTIYRAAYAWEQAIDWKTFA